MTFLGRRTIKALTADTTLTFPGYNGALLTNQGAAGAVTITLPDVTSAIIGCWVEVLVTDAQTVTVATATTDTLIVDGDATADSIAWSTSGHKIGNSATFYAVAVGVGGTTGAWFVKLNPAATTTTIATQTIAT